MKRRVIIRLALVLVIVGPVLWYVSLPYYRTAVCRRRLEEICKMSIIYAGDFDEVYPDSLQRLADFGVDLSILTCPAVKTQRRTIRNVDDWSVYRLIGDLRTDSGPNRVFVYCHPDNHDGRCGHIGFWDLHVETLEKDEFERVLAEDGIVYSPKEP